MNSARYQDIRLIYRNWQNFFYTNSEISEGECKEQYPLKSHQVIKNLGINQTRRWKTYMLRTINHEWRQSKMIQRNGKIFHALLGRINIVKMATMPKTIYRFNMITIKLTGFPRWLGGKEPACQCRRHRNLRCDPSAGKILWRRKWQPIPVFFPRCSHGQRGLVSYGPWGHRVGHDWVTEHAHYQITRGIFYRRRACANYYIQNEQVTTV